MSKECEICGTTENLQEHHISYEPEIKQTLCVKCHQKQHNGHGVGSSRGNGCHPLFDELKDKFYYLRKVKNKNRTSVVNELGISYMTGYLWDRKLRIIEGIYIKESDFAVLCVSIDIIKEVYNSDDIFKNKITEVQNILMRYKNHE